MENKIRELENRIAKLEQIILYLSKWKDVPKYCDMCHNIFDLDDESVKIYNCNECNKHMCIDCVKYYCETCERWNHSECLSVGFGKEHAPVFFCSEECIESNSI
jgi:hypothetical protein